MDTIQFLESIGRGDLADDEGYAAAVGALEITDEERRALLDRDARTLADLLRCRSPMMVQQWTPRRTPQKTPDQEPGRESPDDQDDEPGDEPVKD